MSAQIKIWQRFVAPVLRQCAIAAKLTARRYALRKLRLIFDALDGRLHSAEVRLRNDLSLPVRVESPRIARPAVDTVQVARQIPHDEFVPDRIHGRIQSDHQPQRATPAGSFAEWEAKRSGVATVSKKEARQNRQRKTAREFDLSFAR